MYNDEQNLYHYTYRKDGSESGQQNAGPIPHGKGLEQIFQP